MKHVFKSGGDWDLDGQAYTVKCVNDPAEYLADGWFLTLDEALKAEPEPEPEPEVSSEDLRSLIKALGGKPGPRASIETLQSQLEQLKAEQ